MAAFVLAEQRLSLERREFVERRLSAAAEVLTLPAREALSDVASRESFLSRLRDLSSTTGLRITLIDPNGEALADSEVPGPLPNMSDRPEVRASAAGRASTARRQSALTGKETLYVARSVELDGQRIGTIRVATETSEIDGVLVGLEALLATATAAALGLGLVAGRLLPRAPLAQDSPVDARASLDPRRKAA
ncbi:MAG: hypothetical protein NTY35_14555 [Planctomycetota bacterium]|nr:hypothetical protein [Planctomycetota bacterium]